MEEENKAVVQIRDDMCKRVGISAKWASESKLSVSAYNHVRWNIKDAPSQFAGSADVNIFHLKAEFIYDEPILRSLIAESNSTFLAVQNLRRNGSPSDYVTVSRTYRSIIRACLEKLQNLVDSEELTEDETRYESYVTIFYSIECIWHLCEILLIDQTPTNIVVPQLLEWVRFHYPSAERYAAELLLHGREANELEHYWETVKGLVLQGQVEVARALLQLHSLSETSAYKMAEQILKTMPIYNSHGGLPINRFRSQWQYWLDDTGLKVSAGILSSEPELEEIIQLLTGDTHAWNRQIKKSSRWYEYLPGYLFYTEPACKYFELGTLANVWLSRWAKEKQFRGGNCLNHIDRVILNLMENDMHQVLYAIQKMCDNQWFVTHLTDLLYNCGQLQIMGEQQHSITVALRNTLVFEFGCTLMSRNSLWLIGLDYLEHSSSEGFGAMEVLLTKIPIQNEKKAFKIIDVAKRKGLTSVEKEICRVQSAKSMSNQRYGSALEWAIRSKDNLFVTSLADFFLNHYSKTGKMLCPDVLSNIGAKMFISPRLVFLVKYFDFHQYYNKREFIPAAELLVNLLDSKITPEYFWPSLLTDTIPLLESKDPKIPSKETFIIMHHLESELVPLIEKRKKIMVATNSKQPNLLRDYRIENIEELVNLLRLACARNLSRAIIIENTEIS